MGFVSGEIEFHYPLAAVNTEQDTGSVVSVKEANVFPVHNRREEGGGRRRRGPHPRDGGRGGCKGDSAAFGTGDLPEDAETTSAPHQNGTCTMQITARGKYCFGWGGGLNPRTGWPKNTP